MYRQIITPENTKLILQLPAELVGKEVEVIAFAIEESPQLSDRDSRKYSLEKARKFFDANKIDMSNFIFNRDDAIER